MKKTTLFVDIGGVFLTNGWDRHSRELAAQTFSLDLTELNSRHSLFFGTYEIGKLTLDDYLKFAIFHQPRSFTVDEFKSFMFAQSQPFPEMIQLLRTLKQEHNLTIVTVSNEGIELSDYRIDTFKLKEFVDVFVISGYVGFMKPNRSIYDLALETAQVKPEEVIYIDDRLPFIEFAASLGIVGVHHQNVDDTRNNILSLLKSIHPHAILQSPFKNP